MALLSNFCTGPSFTLVSSCNNSCIAHPQYLSNSKLAFSSSFFNNRKTCFYSRSGLPHLVARVSDKDSDNDSDKRLILEDEVDDIGVKAALSILRFYKSEISPLLPKSCGYVPTCSEYSMIAYKKYGFVKGTALTACRICRCNPLGGTGFDPPRWFGESDTQDQ